jgi:hypothetical protein
MDRDFTSRNDEERQRLSDLLNRLTSEDLSRTLEAGWTISVVLAHLAFWDRRGHLLLDGWRRGLVPPLTPSWYSDTLNDTLLPEWQALPPTETVRLAIEAAEAIDATIRTLEDGIVEEILRRDEGWRVNRWRHRREHIEQIERALRPRA